MRRLILIGLSTAGLSLAADAAAQNPLSVGPTFSCDRATETLSRVICSDASLRRLDVELTQPYYTLRYARPGRSEELRQQAISFQRMVRVACSVPVNAMPSPDRVPALVACVSEQYRAQRAAWLDQIRLTGNSAAIEEAERPIERHLELQALLREQGYLPAGTIIDGIFGPATRAAIREMQRQRGISADGFISEATAVALATEAPATGSAAAASGRAPSAVPRQSEVPSDDLIEIRWEVDDAGRRQGRCSIRLTNRGVRIFSAAQNANVVQISTYTRLSEENTRAGRVYWTMAGMTHSGMAFPFHQGRNMAVAQFPISKMRIRYMLEHLYSDPSMSVRIQPAIGYDEDAYGMPFSGENVGGGTMAIRSWLDCLLAVPNIPDADTLDIRSRWRAR